MKPAPVSFCGACGAGLLPATIAEIKDNSQRCAECGKTWIPNRTAIDVCEDLEARIKFLEGWVLGDHEIRRKN